MSCKKNTSYPSYLCLWLSSVLKKLTSRGDDGILAWVMGGGLWMVLGGLRVVGGGLWLIGGGLLLVEGGQLASVVGEREVVALHHQAADAAAQHLTHARLATLKRYPIIYALYYLKNT